MVRIPLQLLAFRLSRNAIVRFFALRPSVATLQETFCLCFGFVLDVRLRYSCFDFVVCHIFKDCLFHLKCEKGLVGSSLRSMSQCQTRRLSANKATFGLQLSPQKHGEAHGNILKYQNAPLASPETIEGIKSVLWLWQLPLSKPLLN